MATTICVMNQKGGVGKTTTSVNVAGILATRGFRVLLIDNDPQGSTTAYYDKYYEKDDPAVLKGMRPFSIYDVYNRESMVPVSETIRKTKVSNLDLLPADYKFKHTDGELFLVQSGKEFVLTDALESVLDSYDYIIIDCPPADNNLTANALVAANYILLPNIADKNALTSIAAMISMIKNIKRSNPRLKILGTLITMDEKTRNKAAYKQAIINCTNFPALSTVIRKNTRIAEAINNQVPVHMYDASCTGAADYNALVDELLSKMG